MKKKSLLSVIIAFAMLLCIVLPACNGCNSKTASEYTVSFDVGSEASAAGVSAPETQTVKAGEKVVQPTVDAWEGHTLTGWYNGSDKWDFTRNTVNSDLKLKASWNAGIDADTARRYEENLTWGEPGHMYIHYLRAEHSVTEQGMVNSASAPDYSAQINSSIYGDWGLWVWDYFPNSTEGRAFYPMKIDESGAVYDIDLKASYSDGGWDESTRDDKGLTITYGGTSILGIQVYSADSRINGTGFWVNDGGDVYVELADSKRVKGDYHWFVTQGSVGNGSATFTNFEVDDPYAGLEPGSAVTEYDVVSNKGNNNVYAQQPVAEGWEENSVGYQVFIASFADGNGDGMGDLRGVINKLDYLSDLGIDTLWLTPFQTSNSYHGYDIMDYFTVDPRFGTIDDYRELLFKAHQKGMKVLMDFVLNHTSISNPWFVKSQNLVKETIKLPDGTKKEIDYRNFYTWKNEEYVQSIKNPAAKAQWFKDSNGYYFYSSFGSSMPELNFDYQATRDAILDVALYWMSFGLDGFRLDAVKHIYMANESRDSSDRVVTDISADGDYSFDMKKNAHFFTEFNAKLKASYPNALLLGENFNGDPMNLAGMYEGLDSQFNFNWYYDSTYALNGIATATTSTVRSENAKKIMNQYAAAQFDFSLFRKDYIDGVFTSNHDVQRARDKLFKTDAGVPLSSKRGDANWNLSENLAKLWGGMCLTVPGLTWIYNGDELGMFGTKTANPAGDSSGHEDRWYRQPMKWTKDVAGSSDNCNYQIGFNNYTMKWDSLNMQLDGVEEQRADVGSVFNSYKSLIKIRKENPVLSRGKVVNRYTAGSVICYSVCDADTEILVYVNAGTNDAVCNYTVPDGARLLYGNGLTGSGRFPAMSMQIYRVK